MTDLLQRALDDLADHPDSSAREISRRIGTTDDRWVFAALNQAAYDGRCQRWREGRGPWRWQIPASAGVEAATGGDERSQDHGGDDDE